MNNFPLWRILTILVTTSLVSGCMQAPVLTPEASRGAIATSQGGIIYSIPPEDPVMKMKLVSLGLNHEKMLHLRMYFYRIGAPAAEYLDPREQSIVLPDSNVEIHPAKVYANPKKKPVVSLAEPAKQVVELLFPIPKGGHEFPFIKLNWKVHYSKDAKPQEVARTERYDLTVPDREGYLNFPNTEPWILPIDSEWVETGWMWW